MLYLIHVRPGVPNLLRLAQRLLLECDVRPLCLPGPDRCWARAALPGLGGAVPASGGRVRLLSCDLPPEVLGADPSVECGNLKVRL